MLTLDTCVVTAMETKLTLASGHPIPSTRRQTLGHSSVGIMVGAG